MIQPLCISTIISAISVVTLRKLIRKEVSSQKVLKTRRLDPS